MKPPTRRALLFGGAASLLASTALADTAFTSFSFSATGGSSSRTEPNRWADYVNVKDYGAVGDGSTDDTVAIQAAINALVGQGGTSGASRVYFPAVAPNYYKITSALLFNNNNSTKRIVFFGDGLDSLVKGSVTAPTLSISSITWSANVVTVTTSTPHGLANSSVFQTTIAGATTSTQVNGTWQATVTGTSTFTYALSGSGTVGAGSATWALTAKGYCFASYLNTGVNGPAAMENMAVTNTATSFLSGAVYNATTIGFTIRQCFLTGFNVVNMVAAGASGTMSSGLSNCVLSCSASQSVGNKAWAMALGNGHQAIGCDLAGFDDGIRISNEAQVIIGGRIERCTNAIVIGRDDVGNSSQATAFFISAVSMEANDVGILGISGNGTLDSLLPAGTANSPGGVGVSGIDTTGLGAVTVISCSPTGNFSTGCFNLPSNQAQTFISCQPNLSGGGGSNWVGGVGCTFVNCNEGSSQHSTTFSSLPSSPWIGQTMIITDCNSTTVGATAAGGGSSTVPVQWWGSHWKIAAGGT